MKPKPEKTNKVEQMDAEIRSILTAAAKDVLRYAPDYIAVNPTRALRIITRVSEAVNRLIVDLGGDDDGEDENVSKGVAFGPAGLTYKRKSDPMAMLEPLLSSTQHSNAAAQKRNLLQAIQAARDLGDAGLEAKLREDLAGLFGAPSTPEPALPEDAEEVPGPIPVVEPVVEIA